MLIIHINTHIMYICIYICNVCVYIYIFNNNIYIYIQGKIEFSDIEMLFLHLWSTRVYIYIHIDGDMNRKGSDNKASMGIETIQ